MKNQTSKHPRNPISNHMALTRSAAAAATRAASRHPQCIEAFREGLGSVLRQWTALELAIYHQWGGPASSVKAEVLQVCLF